MSANVGNLDRLIRLVAGIVLVVLFVNGTVMGALGVVVFILGIVLIATAIFKWCPIYKALGLNTCPR